MSKQHPHEGHRQRLKDTFLKTSLDTFQPHNILELLLFYSIPRQDTNEIAHELINHFGSLKNVFDADYEELIRVKGIKENSAVLIKMIPQLAKIYLSNKPEERELFDSFQKVGDYLVNLFIGEINETIYIMLLDNSSRLIRTARLTEGNLNTAIVNFRSIIDLVVTTRAARVIIAHNHPNGDILPSSEDFETTRTLFSLLNGISVDLVEHFLIADDRYVPLIKQFGVDWHMGRPKLKDEKLR